MGTILVTDTGIRCLLDSIIIQILKERGERHARLASGLRVGPVGIIAAARVLVEFGGLRRMQWAAWWRDLVSLG
jgi:hypothetical protein